MLIKALHRRTNPSNEDEEECLLKVSLQPIRLNVDQVRKNTDHIVGRESKPGNSDFYQNDFLSMQKYQTHGAHSVKFL